MTADPGLAGKALTVLGPIPARELGVTLPHEHLLCDITCFYLEPEEATLKGLARQPVTLEVRGWIHYHWTSNLDNLRLWDEATAVAEARHIVLAGGRTVVDPTNIGLGRDPLALVRIARATGLHIIMGSGHYVDVTHSAEVRRRDEESIGDEIVRDLTVGVKETGVRAGFIGEIGCSWPWTESEKKCMRGAVNAQRATGAPLMVHPGRNPRAPFEIMEFLGKEGADPTRTIMCHIERTSNDHGWLRELAATGCYLEYDNFGRESSYYPPAPDLDIISDAQRMDLVRWHLEQGHGPQILLSHDLATKTHLHAYGGTGYDHLLTNVVPRFKRRGVSDESLYQLLVENPARAFTFPSEHSREERLRD